MAAFNPKKFGIDQATFSAVVKHYAPLFSGKLIGWENITFVVHIAENRQRTGTDSFCNYFPDIESQRRTIEILRKVARQLKIQQPVLKVDE